MATLQTSKVASTVPVREPHSGNCVVFATYTLAAALALNDVIEMVKIPSGAKIIDMVLATTDLDTNGAPAIVLDVGDGADTDRFIDGTTIGQTGGTVRLGSGITTNTHVYSYTADDTIDVLVQVGPATGAASGTVSLAVTYTLED